MTGEAQPVYFPSGPHTLFGWIHTPRSLAASDLGVVICSPFGYETICAHRSLRAFADTCAAAGVPALRFDYRATGDSSDAPAEEDQIAGWCDDVRAAIEFLQRTCSVRRICLLGVRLGALLAARVAALQEVHYLVAVAPVVSGSRYLRELRAFQANASADAPAGAPNNTASAASLDGQMEVAGFPVSQASTKSLREIDLSKLMQAPQVAVLILDRDDLPCASSWSAALESKGVEVQYAALPGFTNMVSTPHASIVPAAMIGAVAQWLQRHGGAADTAQGISAARIPGEPRMHVTDDGGVELLERAVFIDHQGILFGIVTESVDRASGAEAPGVILLNTGATSHVGPNRMYVELARGWAARGYVVLRFDLAGLGESATRAGKEANQVYPADALNDVRSAIEFVREQLHVRNITLLGVCSGAYHALRSAVSGLPISKVLVINPLTFYWKEGSNLEDLQISEVVVNPGVYARNAFSRRHWVKLLRGKVNLWRACMVFLRRSWLSVESASRDLCRGLRIRLPEDLGWDLQTTIARGVRVIFLFAHADAGRELLRLQAGSTLKGLGQLCRIHVIQGADHIFTQRRARQRLVELLSSELPTLCSQSEEDQSRHCICTQRCTGRGN